MCGLLKGQGKKNIKDKKKEQRAYYCSSFVFPELAPGSPVRQPPSGTSGRKAAVCFSGGGTRAMTAAMGQMRALRTLGLWEKLFYISGVSGGAWATGIFTYYTTGAANDDELLGTSHAPQDLTLAVLNNLSSTALAHTATSNLAAYLAFLLAEVAAGREEARMVWIDAVGATFIAPYGLYSK